MARRPSTHYGVYLIAGVIVTTISLIAVMVGETENPEAMQLFAAIGGLFILIGIAKWLVRKMRQVKKGEKELENRIAGGTLDPSIISCPRCGTKNYTTSNFCHICGMRL